MKKKVIHTLSMLVIIAMIVQIFKIPVSAASYNSQSWGDENHYKFYVETYDKTPSITFRQNEISVWYNIKWDSKRCEFKQREKRGYGKYKIYYREVYSDGSYAWRSSWKSTSFNNGSKKVTFGKNSRYEVRVIFQNKLNITTPTDFFGNPCYINHRETCFWAACSTVNCGIYY